MASILRVALLHQILMFQIFKALRSWFLKASPNQVLFYH